MEVLLFYSEQMLILKHVFSLLDPGLHRGLHPDGARSAVRPFHPHVQHRQGERALLLEPHPYLRPVQGEDALPC